jgi:hypothetical protein
VGRLHICKQEHTHLPPNSSVSLFSLYLAVHLSAVPLSLSLSLSLSPLMTRLATLYHQPSVSSRPVEFVRRIKDRRILPRRILAVH